MNTEQLTRRRTSVVGDTLRAMRVHQWSKNVLIFVPLTFAHQYFEPGRLAGCVIGFLFFSLTASAIYVVNDIADTEHDRRHASKRHRPFASGALSVGYGRALALVLLLVSVVGSALLLPRSFLAVVLLYLVLTTLYTFYLKQHSTIDVITLTCLYTLRIVAGAAVAGVPISPWLLSFSLFFFLSLAYMKRFIELGRVEDGGGIGFGRGYGPEERTLVMIIGIVNGGLSTLSLALYANSEFVHGTYRQPEILWLICPLMMFWIYRAWVCAVRDEVDDDPVVFALRDPVSLLAAFIGVGVVMAAKYLDLNGLLT